MPEFAANLTLLFTEVSFLDRFALARDAGFTRVEYLFPYPYDAAVLKAALETNGLQQVLFNLPSGDWSAGDRGIGAVPGREEEFRAGVPVAIEYALMLGVKRLNCLAGKRAEDHTDEQHWQTLVQNARFAATQLAKHGLELLVEPINHFDVPGFFLNRTEVALRLLDEIDQPNVMLQYDIYHAQREEGELAATIRKHLDRIGHIQIADNPGRNQPGTGEINFPFLFRLLDELNYPGTIGLEYVPTPDTAGSLGWLGEWGLNRKVTII
jgi:hydroxypyruvate isomerase